MIEYDSSDHMNDMQCMLEIGSGKLLMGGHQDNLVTVDLETRHIEAIPIKESSCAILRHHPRFVCSGDTSGKVCIFTLIIAVNLRLEYFMTDFIILFCRFV